MIRSLQSLRAVGAIMIFIHHFGFEGAIVASFGDCAVNWFMMLSGFVLCAAGDGRPSSNPSTRRFMAARFRRIAPLYYVSLALMLAINRFDIGMMPLAASLLMVQSWFPNSDIFFSLNSPAWFISDLMFCYLLFLPLNRLLGSRRRRPFIAAGLALYVAVTVLTPSQQVLFLVYIFPPMQLASFIAGMILWKWLAAKPKPALSATRTNLLILMAIGLVVASIVLYRYVPPRFSLSCYWWVSTALLLATLTVTDRVDCAATRLLHWRPLILLGNAGLSFYLLHLPWIRLTRLGLDALDLSLPLAAELPLSILVLALLSLTLHRLITR